MLTRNEGYNYQMVKENNLEGGFVVKKDNICSTRYPFLLIHGTGSIDPIHWGRIPSALEQHGAVVFFGQQDSWADIETNAAGIAVRIDEILTQTHAEKVNIIGHSKGGLEARMVASSLGMQDKIASITTVATPHYGSKTIDGLARLPHFFWRRIAASVNRQAAAAGDKHPDCFKVCNGFTTEYMQEFNENNPNQAGILYQSYACILRFPFSSIILFLTKLVVYYIEGQNDGFVTTSSASWGNRHSIIYSNSLRGISHQDAVDIKKKPLTTKGGSGVSDICDVYVQIAKELKIEGL